MTVMTRPFREPAGRTVLGAGPIGPGTPIGSFNEFGAGPPKGAGFGPDTGAGAVGEEVGGGVIPGFAGGCEAPGCDGVGGTFGVVFSGFMMFSLFI